MGPMGPAGPVGPAGPAGNVGVLPTQIINAASDALPAGSSDIRIYANCPPGEHVLGGGYSVGQRVGIPPNQISPITVDENRPFRVTGGIDQWLVGGINLDQGELPAGALRAYAVCTNGAVAH